MQTPTIWIVNAHGLNIYVDGKIVGTIPVSQFPNVILDMAKVLKDELN